MSVTRAAIGLVCTVLLSGPIAVLAATAPANGATAAATEELQEIVVFARAENLVGKATAASEGAVGGADLMVRPMLRVADLLEAVPGLIAAQHSGSGKANQYFLRGFNLDHGTDFTTYVDDVPTNLRTHGHGQGYLDLNGLIPETVERIDYRKGPYRADLGDNALAGASFITTVKHFQKPFLGIEDGQYGWQRVAAGSNFSVAGGDLLLAGQWKTYDGPWQLREHLQHLSTYGKYSRLTALGQLEISLSGYDAKWRPTEQIPERAIGTAICANEFCALDRSATGITTRYISSARLMGQDWRATFYAQYYDWNMYSDSTYDFQIRQWDRRLTYGGRYERNYTTSDHFSAVYGAEARFDDIHKVQVDHTDQRQFISYVSAHRGGEGSAAGYIDATWTPIPALRVLGGLRADDYRFHVHATQPGFASGTVTDSIVSPKVGLAYKLSASIELYANWGQGFHSNDGRGVITGVPGLVRGTGYEAGARFAIGNLSLTTTYWLLDVASELKFVGDSNSVEPGPKSQRKGYELVSFWRPLPWLAMDAVWAASHARYLDTPGAEFIANAVENAGELGISAIQGPWEASVRLRHLGPYPLIEDNSQRASAENMVNLRAAWKRRHMTVYGELLNVLNERGKDIVYWYETYLPAIDSAPTEGRVSRAEEPRTLRAGVKYEF
jgi:outer membrane receptor protein involved in Fe transport